MIFPAPTVAEERSAVLHERVRRLRKERRIGDDDASRLLELWPLAWKTHGTLLAVVFFFLTCIGLAAYNGVVSIFGLPRGAVVLISCLAAAEFLIRRQRMFRTGIETALIAGGFVSFITSLPSEGKPEALLVFAAAAATTAWRVHSAIFATVTILLGFTYIAVKADDAVVLATGAGFALAAAFALALLRTIRRPWIEQWFSYSIVALIPAIYIAARVELWTKPSGSWLGATFAIAAVALVVTGLAARHHAHLIAGVLCAIAVVIELWDSFAFAPEAKLMVLGVGLLAGTLLATRLMRGRESGIVATPLSLTSADEGMQMVAASVAAASIAHPPAPAAAPGAIGSGGAGGGAGATGDW
jgi:hypothetical protein